MRRGREDALKLLERASMGALLGCEPLFLRNAATSFGIGPAFFSLAARAFSCLRAFCITFACTSSDAKLIGWLAIMLASVELPLLHCRFRERVHAEDAFVVLRVVLLD